MRRTTSYFLLLVVVALLQTFLFDRLLLFAEVLPVVYITFVVLLPMRCTQMDMLLLGVAVGVLFDLLMGMMGVNSIATIFICYIRRYIINLTLGKDLVVLGDVPTPNTVGRERFLRYIVVMVLVHSAVVFSVEYFNFGAIMFLARRIILSSIVTVPFVWIVSNRFDQLLSRKK